MDNGRKLQMIEAYNKEYYKGRFYHFTDNGFVLMNNIDTLEGTALYIADLYIEKEARSKSYGLLSIFKYLIRYERESKIVAMYCRVEKSNPYYKTLLKVYKKFHFKEIFDDLDSKYYKRISP